MRRRHKKIYIVLQMKIQKHIISTRHILFVSWTYVVNINDVNSIFPPNVFNIFSDLTQCVIYRPRKTKKCTLPTLVYHHSRRENCFQAQLRRHPLQKKMLDSKIERSTKTNFILEGNNTQQFKFV